MNIGRDAAKGSQPAVPAGGAAAADRRLVDWRASVRRASRACCCPAMPAVVVILPAAPGRPYPVDLLLCRHHYRVCEHMLVVAGAAVFGTSGAPLASDPALVVR
jgi:hypothetical protein